MDIFSLEPYQHSALRLWAESCTLNRRKLEVPTQADDLRNGRRRMRDDNEVVVSSGMPREGFA